MKECNICHIVKDESEFYKVSKKNDRRLPRCKECENKRAAEYRKKNIEARLAHEKEYREKNRELINQRRKEYRKTEKWIKKEAEYREKNVHKIKIWSKQWKEKNIKKYKEYQKMVKPKYVLKWRKELRDWYIVDLIFKYKKLGLSRDEIRANKDLMEAKRAEILIERIKLSIKKFNEIKRSDTPLQRNKSY